MATEKQIAANKMNALKSTGPNTTGGKLISRKNSLKHGLLARESLISFGDGKENDHELEDLLDQLKTDLQPIGSLESLLVEQIAVGYWRYRRVLRTETGLIRRQTEGYRKNFYDP